MEAECNFEASLIEMRNIKALWLRGNIVDDTTQCLKALIKVFRFDEIGDDLIISIDITLLQFVGIGEGLLNAILCQMLRKGCFTLLH